MLNSLDKKYPFNVDLRANLNIIVAIGLGMFLFLLFFQPFLPQNSDFNNKLIILAGFGGITMILLYLLRIAIPAAIPAIFTSGKWTFSKELILGFIFLVLNSVAFVFYARYVGGIHINFRITIIIVIMSLAAVAVLININELRYLKNQIKQLSEQELLYTETEDNTSEEQSIIQFESEIKSEYFNLLVNQIILIKSANNYIKVIYKQDEKVNHRLIRNTMKNAEKLFSNYPSLIRCHRSCIVNKNYIEKISKNESGLKLTLSDYPETIFVSRQYVLTLKKALKAN